MALKNLKNQIQTMLKYGNNCIILICPLSADRGHIIIELNVNHENQKALLG